MPSFSYASGMLIDGLPETLVPCWPTLGAVRRIVAHNSQSPGCLQFIQECLRNCCSLHKACCQPQDKILPKRVLDIGLDNSSMSLRITDHERANYAVLSYCWGKTDKMLRTTGSNLEKFESKIPWDDLPRTLQDAIVVVRQLGLRYIWIDCLCIIQDRISDWEVEASKMAAYFQNAHITIAATAAPHADFGIFAERPKIYRPRIIILADSDGEEHQINVQRSNLINTLYDSYGPLCDGAWAYQENVLSTRVIHFTKVGIIWECRTEMIFEDGWPVEHWSDNGLIERFLTKATSRSKQCWMDMVTSYSHRNLTFVTDKLPAIAGIATQLQKQTGFRYTAGLWQETLLHDLMWTSL
jgi:Heterokaryon incompatibility protein (HET)